MPDLLLELFGEEIPASMQARAAEDLKRLVCNGCRGANLPFETAKAYVTPRRLILRITGLPKAQPDARDHPAANSRQTTVRRTQGKPA